MRGTARGSATRPATPGGGRRWLAAIAIAAPCLMIAANVLMMQGAPHPAPLFGARLSEHPRPVATIVPLPPARATAEGMPTAAAAQPGGQTPATATPAMTQAATTQAARPAAPRDPIVALLQSQQAQTERATQVQRALNRLGYGPLKEDGALGPASKAALERFERERRLPVTGEAGGRTLRELASAAGMAID